MNDLIREARKLCENVTHGQWKRHDTANYTEIHNGDTWGKDLSPIALVGHTDDANFIARSRTLIPELCDALEKATAKNDELIRELSELARESVKRDMALARLEAEVGAACNSVRWIPVTERLPEERGDYLCTYLGAVFMAEFRYGFWSVNSNKVGSALWGVTHWMPLPAPPEEGAENERD